MKKKIIITILVILLTMGGVLLYSRFIGTTGLVVKEYKITDSSLPDYFHGFKIVHISDIHYGRVTKQKELQNIVNKINELKPDVVVLTGDLIDKDTNLTPEMVDQLSNLLNQIQVTIQKYAIEGNHDVRFDNWETIIENGGFVDLNDSYDFIYHHGDNPILISGVSSNLNSTLTIHDKMKDIFAYLTTPAPTEEPLPNKDDKQEPQTPVITSIYNILLIHEPDFLTDIDTSPFNLILAGHSHNGQVRLPFIGAIILPEGSKKYYKEYYTLNNTDLYISSGIGTSTVNFRLFNRPSINFYRLTNH